MSPEIPKIYQNRTRIRACGLCWRDGKLLMVNHRGLSSGNFWAPPGGGVEFGESAHATLIREFREETHVRIETKDLLFVCEFIQPPLHALELFFSVDDLGGDPQRGRDPESDEHDQLITDIRFMTLEEILAVPEGERHGIFKHVQNAADVKNLSGFYRI